MFFTKKNVETSYHDDVSTKICVNNYFLFLSAVSSILASSFLPLKRM